MDLKPLKKDKNEEIMKDITKESQGCSKAREVWLRQGMLGLTGGGLS